SLCHKVSSEFLKTNAPDPHNWILSSCFHAFLSIWVHLGPFRYHTKLKAKRAKLVQLIQNFVRIFATNAPDPHRWTLNSCFGVFLFCLDAFGNILLLHETCCKTRQTGAINAKVLCHDVLLEFFTTNAPDPHNWNPSSCFHPFLSIWVHLGPFRYHTKLKAKRAKLVQLMQKFV